MISNFIMYIIAIIHNLFRLKPLDIEFMKKLHNKVTTICRFLYMVCFNCRTKKIFTA